MEVPVIDLTADRLYLNKKKTKGGKLSLFIVCRNEEGAQVEVPYDADAKFHVKIKGGGIRSIKQRGGRTNITALYVENVVGTGSVTVDSPTIINLVASQTVLGRTEKIGRCYTGCPGAHVNNLHRPISVVKSRRNPFDFDTPKIAHDLRKTWEKYDKLKNRV